MARHYLAADATRWSHLCWALLVAGPLMLCRDVAAVTRLPESFNIEKDWDEKEKYMQAKPYIRCQLCKVLVGNTLEAIGDAFQEDDVYDHIDKICDAKDVYESQELWENRAVEPPNSLLPQWMLIPSESARTPHQILWQSHAMKELCDNIIQPVDDEIKDACLKAKRKASKKGLPGLGNSTEVIQQACEAARLCKPGEQQAVISKPSTAEEL